MAVSTRDDSALPTHKVYKRKDGDYTTTDNETGSTACFAPAWLEGDNTVRVTSANLGDSEAWLIVLDRIKPANFSYAVRVNKKLHNASNPDERNRIECTFDPLTHKQRKIIERNGKRVSGRLTCSRSIGDKDILTHESDHEPDIDYCEYKLHAYEQAFLVVGCDGVFDCLLEVKKSERILNTVFKHRATPHLMAEALVGDAYIARETLDNISVTVVPIRSGDPVSAVVFDGHGSDIVSKGLGLAFYPLLTRLTKETHDKFRISDLRRTKELFLSDLHLFLRCASKNDIVDLFAILKNRNGIFREIHKNKNPRYDSVRLIFSKDETWDTKTYKTAIELMQTAYTSGKTILDPKRYQDEQSFLAYNCGQVKSVVGMHDHRL